MSAEINDYFNITPILLFQGDDGAQGPKGEEGDKGVQVNILFS